MAFECFSSTFQGKFNFQGLFKTVLYIQVLFKPVPTLNVPINVPLSPNPIGKLDPTGKLDNFEKSQANPDQNCLLF